MTKKTEHLVVSEERWKTAQEFENNLWIKINQRNSYLKILAKFVKASRSPKMFFNYIKYHDFYCGDDWNYWWMKKFENYKVLPKSFEKALEIGCGPYTNIRLISKKCKIKEIYCCEPEGGERMRLNGLSLVALCGLVLSCSSTTNVGERELRLLDYSLSEVDGEALPGPLSSLPGLVIWEGDDGSKLTVANGHLSCAADGTAEEGYLFRLARQGSAVWDPIRVNLELTCELTGPGSVRFRNRLTGEVLEGKILERFDGCPVFEKRLPSLESLRIGYAPANSGAEFPAELEFSGPPIGDFLAVECLSG